MSLVHYPATPAVKDGKICFAWPPGLYGFAIIIWCYGCQTNKLLPSLLNTRLSVWKARISLVFCFLIPPPSHIQHSCFLSLHLLPVLRDKCLCWLCSKFSEVSYLMFLSLLAFLSNVSDARLASYRTSVLFTCDIVCIWQLCSLASKFSVFSWPSHKTLVCGLWIWYYFF